MKATSFSIRLMVGAIVMVPALVNGQTPMGTAFTYQGQLKQGGKPVNGLCDMGFGLWDDPTSQDTQHRLGHQTISSVPAKNGLFTVKLNDQGVFGAEGFNGDARWLEIAARCPGGTGSYTTLTPRQELTPGPYAIFATKSAGGAGLWSVTGNDIYNNHSGNVGIGTTNPQGILDVAGPNGGDILIGVNNVGARIIATDPDGNLNLKPRVDDVGAGVVIRDGNTPKGIRLLGGGMNHVQSLGIDGTSPFALSINPEGGNVGIGTDAPASRLDVAGEARMEGARFPGGFGPDSAYVGTPGNYLSFGHSGVSEDFIGYKSNTFYFKDSPGGADTLDPDVVVGGKVGIGITPSNAQLDVSGPAGGTGIYGEAGGKGLSGRAYGTTGYGVHGLAVGQKGHGVHAEATGGDGVGVYAWSKFGNAVAAHTSAHSTGDPWIPAIYGKNEGAGDGVYGWSKNRHGTCGVTYSTNPEHAGVSGINNGTGVGVYGKCTVKNPPVNEYCYGGFFEATSDRGIGVYGEATGGSGYEIGVEGRGTNAGVSGFATDTYGISVYGFANRGTGVQGNAVGEGGRGVEGNASGANAIGVFGYAYSLATLAGKFVGDVEVFGYLDKQGGGFKIDHPLDPENKYLYHGFVESPDMMNVYNGNVVLDGDGEARVELAEWFGALNRDYRYQLTAIGAPGPNLYVAEEINDNRFKIAGGKPGMKVSWQVTGIRQDPWANANCKPVEVEKADDERGTYLAPEAYGMPKEMRTGYEAMQERLSRRPVRDTDGLER